MSEDGEDYDAGEDEPFGKFQGFDAPHYTPIPDELFDWMLPKLGLAELKVLLYISRRTLGFKRNSDAISIKQICQGIVRRDGERLDAGTGLTPTNAVKAIRRLQERHLITAYTSDSADKGHTTTVYTLNVHGASPTPVDDCGGSAAPPTATPTLVPQQEYPTPVAGVPPTPVKGLPYSRSRSTPTPVAGVTRNSRQETVNKKQLDKKQLGTSRPTLPTYDDLRPTLDERVQREADAVLSLEPYGHFRSSGASVRQLVDCITASPPETDFKAEALERLGYEEREGTIVTMRGLTSQVERHIRNGHLRRHRPVTVSNGRVNGYNGAPQKFQYGDQPVQEMSEIALRSYGRGWQDMIDSCIQVGQAPNPDTVKRRDAVVAEAERRGVYLPWAKK